MSKSSEAAESVTKIPEEQIPGKLGSVARVPEYWWDILLWRELSCCLVLSGRQGGNVLKNLLQGMVTTGWADLV